CLQCGIPTYTRISYVFRYVHVYRGIPARPFQGWSVKILPVQSTVLAPPRNWMDDHAFTARTEAVDSTPAARFFVGCSVAPLLGPFRTRKAGATCLACAVFRKSWKSRSFEKT